MITTVTNSSEMRQALNENLHGLLTGKRKPLVVKEVNNTLGKMLIDVKMELMTKVLIRDTTAPLWYGKTLINHEVVAPLDVLKTLKDENK